jgi:hypothetical protein
MTICTYYQKMRRQRSNGIRRGPKICMVCTYIRVAFACQTGPNASLSSGACPGTNPPIQYLRMGFAQDGYVAVGGDLISLNAHHTEAPVHSGNNMSLQKQENRLSTCCMMYVRGRYPLESRIPASCDTLLSRGHIFALVVC